MPHETTIERMRLMILANWQIPMTFDYVATILLQANFRPREIVTLGDVAFEQAEKIMRSPVDMPNIAGLNHRY